MSGLTTRVTPGEIRAGLEGKEGESREEENRKERGTNSWKHNDFPPPVGIRTKTSFRARTERTTSRWKLRKALKPNVFSSVAK